MRNHATALLLSAKREGIALFDRRDYANALVLFKQASDADSADRDVWNYTARTLESLGRLEESLACIERALELSPNDTSELLNRAHLLLRLSRLPEALSTLDRALALQPTRLEALIQRAQVLYQLDRRDEALATATRAVVAQPNHLGSLNLRGMILDDLGRRDEARADYRACLTLDPTYADALTNVAIWHARAGEFTEALEFYEQSLAINSRQLNALYNRAVVKLVLGDWTHGFQEFEHRWALFPHEATRLTRLAPRWRGQEDIRGKTILLHHEQGFGDTLQFCRYAKLAQDRGAKVIMAVPAALKRLLETLPGAPLIVAEGSAIPAHDWHCPLMSLPLAFKTTPATVPANAPYLFANLTDVERWEAWFQGARRLRIGIVWSGRRYPPINYARDAPFEAILPLLDLPADFLCLHKELSDDEQTRLAQCPNIRWVGDQLTDFADTAALVANLDLVITVDSAIAHLAGAMGKPVWLMNRYASCWRWLLGRADSPWYPSLRLFRQPALGDWASVVSEVCHALEKLVSLRRPDRKQNLLSAPRDDAQATMAQLQEGLALHLAGDRPCAIEIYNAVLIKSPRQPDALHYLGVALSQDGRHDEALRALSDAATLQPHSAAVHNHHGNALAGLQRFDEAIKAYDRAIACDPQFVESYYNRGVSRAALGDATAALTCYEQALRIDPAHAKAHNNRGSELFDLGRLSEALECFDHALAVDSAFVDAWVNRSHVLRRLHRYDESLASAQSALTADPRCASAHNGAGAALADLGRTTDAQDCYERAIELDAQLPEAAWNLGLIKLAQGEFIEGWRLYESRWRVKSLRLMRRFADAPLVTEQTDVRGRVVLLHAEQGYGDTIQFSRYATLLAARGARVVLSVPSALMTLMESLAGVEAVVDLAKDAPAFDCHCPLMSLPKVFESTVFTLPAATPYLHADPSKVAHWANVLKDAHAVPKIGLAWAGRGTHHNDQNRSLSIDAILPVVAFKGRWISLHKEVRSGDVAGLQQHPCIERLGEQLTDFADTAALIEQLDLIITVDTAVAHLAAALGKPTWILLPYVADWRWLQSRNDSPWYPSVTLFRQRTPRDWSELIERVGLALKALKLPSFSDGDSTHLPAAQSRTLLHASQASLVV